MTIGKHLLSTVAAVALLLPGLAVAQDDFMLEDEDIVETEQAPVFESRVEFGIGVITDSSFKFGEYTGLENEGAFGVGSFTVRRRDPYDSGGTQYFEATGTNLGLRSRSLRAEFGSQGKYAIYVGYDQIPKFISDSAFTPYAGAGSGDLTLPDGWVAGGNTRGMDSLVDQLRGVNIWHERKRFNAGFIYFPRKNWVMQASFKHETKEGTKTIAGIFGTSGGNPRAAILPEPVDYVTDEIDVSIAYATDKGQISLSYNFSNFDNEKDSLTFDNAYLAHAQWNPAAGFPTGRGRLALPPDNDAFQVTLAGGYTFSPTMRLSGTAAIGEMSQNEDFLAYTVNPDLAVPVALPRDSLNGEIKTQLVNLVFTARPHPKFNIRATYRYDNRDNDTPRDVFLVLGADSQDQPALDSSRARINHPYSSKENQFKVDGTLRMAMRTRLTVGYEYKDVDRTFQEVESLKQHKLKVKLAASLGDVGSADLRFSHAWRDGSEYIGNEPLLTGHSPEYLAGIDQAAAFENLPRLRKFYLADRERTEVAGSMTFVPANRISFGLTGNYSRDDYNESELGLTESTITMITADVSYAPSERFSLHAFYTYEAMDYDQNGYAFRPSGALSDLDDDRQAWSVGTNDRVNSIGVGLNATLVEDKLDVSAEYRYSDAETGFDIVAGSENNIAPISDLENRLHRFKVSATYQLKPNISVKVNYLFEDYESKDFAFDNVQVNTLANVITLGRASPNYNVHVISTSLIWQF